MRTTCLLVPRINMIKSGIKSSKRCEPVIQEHGHCNVPRKDGQYQKLFAWVKNQKYQYNLYKGGSKSKITPERIQALEEIGFSWHVDSNETKWRQQFEELSKFVEDNGHADVPQGFPQNQSLSYWVHNQRRYYKLKKCGKKSYMTEEHGVFVSVSSRSSKKPMGMLMCLQTFHKILHSPPGPAAKEKNLARERKGGKLPSQRNALNNLNQLVSDGPCNLPIRRRIVLRN